MPAPNARRTSVSAAAAIAPAAIAAHDTAGLSSAGVEISTDSKTINVPIGSMCRPDSAEADHNAGEKKSSTKSQRLFPFERVLDRVFDAADGILNLALDLSALPSDSNLESPMALPTACLTAPLTCFAEPATRSLSMIFTSKISKDVSQQMFNCVAHTGDRH